MADALDHHVLLARHYIWQSLLARAGSVPQPLLAQIAMATAAEVPPFPDPVARVEWHIERIIEVAKTMLADQGGAGGLEPPQPPAESSLFAASLARSLAVSNVASLTYPADSKSLVHVAPDGSMCETPLPAVCCACRRYLLIGEVPR